MSGSYLQLSTAKMKAGTDGGTVDPRGWTVRNGSSRCTVCEVPVSHWAGPPDPRKAAGVGSAPSPAIWGKHSRAGFEPRGPGEQAAGAEL